MRCKICNAEQLSIHVARTPISGYTCGSKQESIEQPKFDLDLFFCKNCGMVNYPLHKGVGSVLDKLYSTHLGTYYSNSYLNNYLDNLVLNLETEYQLTNESKILEIGCNNGNLLLKFKEKIGCEVFGVEPSKTFTEYWKQNKLNIINDYFTNEVASTLISLKPDIIIFRHVFEHIQEPLLFFKHVSEICSENTNLIIEVPYLKSVLKRGRIDNISYSHLNYFSTKPIIQLSNQFNMGLNRIEEVETDGGSIIFHLNSNISNNNILQDNIEFNQIKDFILSIEKTKEKLREKFKGIKREEIAGYGAGAKGQHLLHILYLHEIIGTIVDDTKQLQGRFIPGTMIEIENPNVLKNGTIKYIINLVPTHKDTIKKKIPEGIEFFDIFE